MVIRITIAILLGLVCVFHLGAAASSDPPPPSSRPDVKSEPAELFRLGSEAYEAGKYEKALGFFERALADGVEGGDVPYSAACSSALIGRNNAAFQYLAQAIERGYRNLRQLESDRDLVGLHDDPRWARTIRSCMAARERGPSPLDRLSESTESKAAGPPRYGLRPELALELLRRRDIDQRARIKIIEEGRTKPPSVKKFINEAVGIREVGKIDHDNTEYMKKVIAEHGWPGKTLVGEEAAAAAWLLVQHADLNPEFQSECLDLLKKAHENGDATGQQVAYLTDRVLLKQGKKQVYGTQFSSGRPGNLKPLPIEDEANVDARRKAMGLQPLAEYSKAINSQMGS